MATGRDTLEGGAGDDRYILLDDSATDIIIVGEGDDIIDGGGAEDRIVMRIDILDRMYEDWAATFPEGTILLGDNAKKPSERLGEDALTSGIPILGGFWDMAFSPLKPLQIAMATKGCISRISRC
jgi:Ca2+-binding RTX toxin-like protein